MVLKIGMEMEFHLVDKRGEVVNAAPGVLSSPSNNGCIISELSQSMVEVIAPPREEPADAFKEFRSSLVLLQKILDEQGLLALPSTTIGDDCFVLTNDTLKERGRVKRIVLGDEKRDLEHHIAGIHVHIDRPEGFEKTWRQYCTFWQWILYLL